MTAQEVRHTASMDTVLNAIIAPQARLAAHKETAHLAGEFDVLLDEWEEVRKLDQDHRKVISESEARVEVAAQAADYIVNETDKRVLIHVNHDKDAAEYQLYFGAKNLTAIKRLPFKEQLDLILSWKASLAASDNPELVALSQQIEAVVEQGRAALADLAQNKQAYQNFRQIGARKALIDHVNEIRKLVFGKVEQLRFTPEGAHLPSNFARQIFNPRTRRSMTKAVLEEKLESLTNLQTRTEAKRAAVIARLEALANEEAKAKEKAEAVAQAKDEFKEAKAAMRAAKARLSKLT